MPAVLNEAFRSPFDKVLGQGGNTALESSGTSDIRAQAPQLQDLNFSGISGGPRIPYQQNYQIQHPAAPSSGITWGIPQQEYNTISHLDTNQLYPSALPQNMEQSYSRTGAQVHDCDRLIGDIMACRVCRQTLQRLMKAWDDDHPAGPQIENKHGAGLGSGQEGGSSNFFLPGNLSSNLITNIIIGIAIIFLLDRILKLRLVTA